MSAVEPLCLRARFGKHMLVTKEGQSTIVGPKTPAGRLLRADHSHDQAPQSQPDQPKATYSGGRELHKYIRCIRIQFSDKLPRQHMNR